MKNSETKENHYVPQQFLKKFVDSNDILYELDLQTNEIYPVANRKKAFKGICKSTNLYAVKTEISELDIALFLAVFNKYSDDNIKFLREVKRFINNDVFDNNSEGISKNQEYLFSYIESFLFDTNYDFIKNNIELPDYRNNYNIHTVSYLFIKIIGFIHKSFDENTMYKTNSETFFINYIDILFYMLNQYYRTEKILLKIKNAVSKYQDKFYSEFIKTNPELAHLKFDMCNIIYLYLQIYPILQLSGMLNSDYHLILLNNESNIPFIISDNPCVNTIDNRGKDISQYEAELFMPLNPNLALLFTNNNHLKHKNKITIKSDLEIIKYCNIIKKEADRFIFTNNMKELDKYKK